MPDPETLPEPTLSDLENLISIKEAINGLKEIQNAERFRVSTLSYQRTLECLLQVYASHGSHERLLISPTGSKMQAVAVGILRSFVEDIQIVYPTPRGFRLPEKYTIGTGRMHLLDLNEFRME